MAVTQNSTSALKAKAYTLIFSAQTAGALVSALSFSAGESKVSQDGGSFANTTNLPAEIGSTGIYSLALTAAEMDADQVTVLLSKTGMDDQIERIQTEASPSGAVVTDGSNTATTFKTDRTEATDDYWNEAILLFTNSSALAGQCALVLDYNGTTKFVTLNRALTATPTAGDLFVLVNR